MPGTEDSDRPLVELTHVEKHYGDLHVLKDINLTVKKGEVLVIGLTSIHTGHLHGN